MDAKHADSLLRRLSSAVSRRGAIAGLLALATAEAEAKKKGKRKKRKRKKRKKNSTAPPAPVTRADAACSGPGQFGATVPGAGRLAQTFTPLTSGALVSVQMAVSRAGATGGDYILRLSAVDGAGIPTNGVLATAIVSDAGLADGFTTVSFEFPQAPPVAAGTLYALVLARPGASQLGADGNQADVCAGMAFTSVSQTGPFTPAINADFLFTTFVQS